MCWIRTPIWTLSRRPRRTGWGSASAKDSPCSANASFSASKKRARVRRRAATANGPRRNELENPARLLVRQRSRQRPLKSHQRCCTRRGRPSASRRKWPHRCRWRPSKASASPLTTAATRTSELRPSTIPAMLGCRAVPRFAASLRAALRRARPRALLRQLRRVRPVRPSSGSALPPFAPSSRPPRSSVRACAWTAQEPLIDESHFICTPVLLLLTWFSERPLCLAKASVSSSHSL
mmetsp:Transcript_16572/g.42131  ORF Transcript_16572/g.42131 Transcript_16572/m.42131 type:complete len:236 (+) Transcript_16572:123-830(+)